MVNKLIFYHFQVSILPRSTSHCVYTAHDRRFKKSVGNSISIRKQMNGFGRSKVHLIHSVLSALFCIFMAKTQPSTKRPKSGVGAKRKLPFPSNPSSKRRPKNEKSPEVNANDIYEYAPTKNRRANVQLNFDKE